MRCIALILIGLMLAGCGSKNVEFTTPHRMEQGLVIILPGIEGESWMNRDIRYGLQLAGVTSGLPIHPWGQSLPLAGAIINQMDHDGNRREGVKLARMIVQYQDNHPGCPVYLIGHSGGAGICVFAAEALPEGRQIDGMVLLAASLSNSYDLTRALRRSRGGIVSFHQVTDIGFLVLGTTIMGNVDGTRGPAAGAIGFEEPDENAAPIRRQAYTRLFQIRLTPSMTGLDIDAHGSSTRAEFVSTFVAPWVKNRQWPPPPPSKLPQTHWWPRMPGKSMTDPVKDSVMSKLPGGAKNTTGPANPSPPTQPAAGASTQPSPTTGPARATLPPLTIHPAVSGTKGRTAPPPPPPKKPWYKRMFGR